MYSLKLLCIIHFFLKCFSNYFWNFLSLYIIANVPSDEGARAPVLIVIDSLSASISQAAIMTQRINV